MTSVLNVGVMGNNPVGNQIRRLEQALDAERKDKQMLLLALETKAPDVFVEYIRLKEEAEERAGAAARAANAMNQPPRYAQSQPANNNRGTGGYGGRF